MISLITSSTTDPCIPFLEFLMHSTGDSNNSQMSFPVTQSIIICNYSMTKAT